MKMGFVSTAVIRSYLGGGKALFHFAAYTASLREVRARTHGRKLGAGTERGHARVLLVAFFSRLVQHAFL